MKNSSFAFAAICSAIIVVVFYISTVLDTVKIAAGVVATLAGMLIITKSGVKYAWISYAAVSALLFLLLVNKFVALAFSAFFGLYAIVKFYIEKLGKQPLEWTIKILYFNAVIGLAAFIMKLFEIKLGVPLIFLWAAGIVAAVCYDLVLSYGINYISRLLDRYLK